MSKNVVNAHRKRTRLRNKFLKNRTETSRVCRNKERNFCVNLLRKTKKGYCVNLNGKDVIANKGFFLFFSIIMSCTKYKRYSLLTKLKGMITINMTIQIQYL